MLGDLDFLADFELDSLVILQHSISCYQEDDPEITKPSCDGFIHRIGINYRSVPLSGCDQFQFSHQQWHELVGGTPSARSLARAPVELKFTVRNRGVLFFRIAGRRDHSCLWMYYRALPLDSDMLLVAIGILVLVLEEGSRCLSHLSVMVTCFSLVSSSVSMKEWPLQVPKLHTELPLLPGWLVHKQFGHGSIPPQKHQRHVATGRKFGSIRILNIIKFSCQAPCQASFCPFPLGLKFGKFVVQAYAVYRLLIALLTFRTNSQTSYGVGLEERVYCIPQKPLLHHSTVAIKKGNCKGVRDRHVRSTSIPLACIWVM